MRFYSIIINEERSVMSDGYIESLKTHKSKSDAIDFLLNRISWQESLADGQFIRFQNCVNDTIIGRNEIKQRLEDNWVISHVDFETDIEYVYLIKMEISEEDS